MGLFDKLFGNKPRQTELRSPEYKALTAYQPVFTNYNGQIYEADLVRSAINARATHIGKLKVDFCGKGSNALANRLKRPNSFQSWYQFLYRTSTILDCGNTVLIVPVFDEFNRVTEIYPVLPQRCKMVEVNKEPWVAFEFVEGRYAQLPVWQVALLTKFQYKNDFFGENNRALDSTMRLMDIQNQGIMEGVKSSATYRFMAQMGNFAKAEDLAKERKRFDANNFSGDGGGLLLFPNTFNNIQQINSKPFVVDAEQMSIIQKNVFNYFGVNEDVLQNKTYGDSWTAFYEGAIESFAIQFSEVMTALFRLTGQLSGDASVMATANRLQYMSNKEKLEVSAQLADRGILNRNEVREIWNLAPIEGGDEFIIRGEYWNAAEKVNEGENGNASEN